MGLVPGQGLIPESEPFAEALQGGAGSGRVGSRFLVQDDFKTSDYQATHGRLLLCCRDFHTLQKWVWQVNRRSH